MTTIVDRWFLFWNGIYIYIQLQLPVIEDERIWCVLFLYTCQHCCLKLQWWWAFPHVCPVTSDVDSRPSATYGWNEIEATSCFIPMGLSHSNSQQMHAWRTSFKNSGAAFQKTAWRKMVELVDGQEDVKTYIIQSSTTSNRLKVWYWLGEICKVCASLGLRRCFPHVVTCLCIYPIEQEPCYCFSKQILHVCDINFYY